MHFLEHFSIIRQHIPALKNMPLKSEVVQFAILPSQPPATLFLMKWKSDRCQPKAQSSVDGCISSLQCRFFPPSFKGNLSMMTSTLKYTTAASKWPVGQLADDYKW